MAILFHWTVLHLLVIQWIVEIECGIFYYFSIVLLQYIRSWECWTPSSTTLLPRSHHVVSTYTQIFAIWFVSDKHFSFVESQLTVNMWVVLVLYSLFHLSYGHPIHTSKTIGRTRVINIAAVDIDWDYAPLGNLVNDDPWVWFSSLLISLSVFRLFVCLLFKAELYNI